MLNFHKLLTKDYLLNINRVLLTRSDKLFFVIGAAMVILAIVFKIASLYAPNPVDKILRNKFFRLFLTIGISEVIWFGARFENIPFFGSHAVALAILLIGAAWLIQLAASIIKNYKADKVTWEKEQMKLKYLPK